jgi:cytochrome c oxidase cbb3-type subunit III
VVNKFKSSCVLAALIFGTTLFLVGQEPQVSVSNPPPPEPPAGAANGPHPGPAAQPSAAAGRTGGEAKPAAPNREAAMRKFLGIGAPPDPAAVERGQKLFVANCAFCHGSTANGGSTGPDLVRSVIVLHDQGTGQEIGKVILNGRPDKGMPKFNMTEAQIKDIAAFLLSRTQAAANRGSYQIQNIVTGDPKAGETYFNAHCSSCHSPSGDLAHIATKFDPVALQSRFLYPREQRRPGAEGPPPDPRAEITVKVTLASGQSYEGRLDHIDDFSVGLVEPSGEYHSWLFDAEKGIKVDVHNPLQAHADMLPEYTNADMHNILAYLETLK